MKLGLPVYSALANWKANRWLQSAKQLLFLGNLRCFRVLRHVAKQLVDRGRRDVAIRLAPISLTGFTIP